MVISNARAFRSLLLVTSALGAAGMACAAHAADAAAAAESESASTVGELIVTVAPTTRSVVSLNAQEAQKLLPGVSPLKAIQTLPGVVFETADPWGNNEQNESLFVHGFSTQQLGYTMDGVPLGDQQYGNYNGLSVSRALTSENVDHVSLSSGAGVLGVASTSNLGGAIETFSRDPSHVAGGDVRQTLGSYSTTRTFVRLDSGDFHGDNRFYLSYVHHDAKAWDFNGHQRDDQANLKFVHEDHVGKLTLFADWQTKIEPNEDATGFGSQAGGAGAYTPYTRPFIYPDLAAALAYLQTGALPGSPPASQGNNFSNYFSAAQRTDFLLYAKYDWKLASNLTWSNQAYYHYDYGRGIVAGPINQAGLPTLFATYFPALVVGGSATSAGSLQNISNLFGGTGYEVRTTEYRINREGVISTLNLDLGSHKIEAGLWYEHNEPAQHRVWYPFSAANNDLTPYDTPKGQSVFTQYYFQFHVDDVQLHLQDQLRIFPNLLVQAGFKSSLQTARDEVRIQQQNLPTANPPVNYPTGSLTSNAWFLPQVGAVWDATEHEQLFFNVQKNMRQFIPYGAGSNFYGFSPWSLGTQAAFNLFKTTVKPETSWIYEAGARTHHNFEGSFISGIEAQVTFYHVDFANRLLNVAPFNFINPAPSILVNVGSVTTNGVDVAATVHFGPHFSFYDAISYNKTTYDQNYSSGISNGQPVIVATGGKWVPLTPDFLNKFILSTNFGPFEAQLNGDYIGRRYVTYLNDMQVKSTFVMGLEASYRFDLPQGWAKSLRLSANLTNLANVKGVSTAVVTSTSGGYQAFPLPPRMFFVTAQATF
ncbi:MAG TPA: TonB-dependent receptor [Caulobacteraceae bacterium]